MAGPARCEAGDAPRRCALIVVTYNSAADLDGFFDGLGSAAPGVDLSVFIVDNDSSDDTLARVPDRPGVHTIATGANLGYAGGINVGRSQVPAEVPILIANPDMRFAPGAITCLLEALDDAEVGVAVPRMVGPDGGTRRSLRRFPSISRELGEALFGDQFASRPGWLAEMVRDPASYESGHDVEWATGAAYLVAPRCDRELGDWSEEYFLYSEEVDYAARARRAGFRIRYVPMARAMHREGGSGSSPALVMLQAVNRVRYAERFHGRWWAASYRAAVAFHELSRGLDPVRRRSALMVCRRSCWSRLPGPPI